jgi:hypothetical protein
MNIGISVVSDADSDFCVHQIVQTDFSGQWFLCTSNRPDRF